MLISGLVSLRLQWEPIAHGCTCYPLFHTPWVELLEPGQIPAPERISLRIPPSTALLSVPFHAPTSPDGVAFQSLFCLGVRPPHRTSHACADMRPLPTEWLPTTEESSAVDPRGLSFERAVTLFASMSEL